MSVQPTALVIGGTGELGEAVVAALSEQGALIVAASRDGERVKEMAARHRRVEPAVLDVGADGAVEDLVADVVARHGLDIVIVNCGRLELGPIGRMQPHLWREMADTNLIGPARAAAAAAPALVRSTRGRFVAVSSASSLTGLPGRAAYASTKAGLAGLVRSMAAELGHSGATANAVAPGPLDSGLLLEAARTAPGYSEALRNQIPMGRFGTAEEAAAVIGFLVSSSASYVTGQVIAVDGGWTSTRNMPLPTADREAPPEQS